MVSAYSDFAGGSYGKNSACNEGDLGCLAGLPLVPALGFLMQVWCVVCWFGDWSLHLSPFYMRVNAMCIYLPFARQVARQKLTIFS